MTYTLDTIRPMVLEMHGVLEMTDEPKLIIVAKPCWVCEEESDREGGSALNLCNVKRFQAWKRETGQ